MNVMNDLTTRLREADPVRLEPGLTLETRDAIRRAVVAAADARAPRVFGWRQPLAFAAVTVVAVVGATAAYRFAEDREHQPAAAVQAVAVQPTQVQFRTPGGTRIIWTLDPDFQLGGTRR